MRKIITIAFLAATLAAADLTGIRAIYIEKMPNDLDQYIRAEFFKQAKGRIRVVLEKKDADAILTGVTEREAGQIRQVTGRYFGLHDNTTASLSLLDKEEKEILWADEAGDRSLGPFNVMRRGGERKVADRIVKKLLIALGGTK